MATSRAYLLETQDEDGNHLREVSVGTINVGWLDGTNFATLPDPQDGEVWLAAKKRDTGTLLARAKIDREKSRGLG